MIEQIKELVEQQCSDFDLRYHLLPVVQHARGLTETCHANREVVELSAWLHDIGRIKFGAEDHELTGAEEAQRILTQFGYSEDIIRQVRHCILSHRGKGSTSPETIEAKIVATADALAHFDMIPAWLTAISDKGREDVDEMYNWLSEKIDRDWSKKLLIPQAVEMAEEKYRAIKLILEGRASGKNATMDIDSPRQL